MHKYMRAIGFSEYTDRKKLKELLTDVIMNSDHRAYTMNQEGILLGEFSKNHTATRGAIESGTFGVAVCGEFDDNDKFKAGVVAPIVHDGDPVGTVIFIAEPEQGMNEVEQKLAETAAGFLGKALE